MSEWIKNEGGKCPVAIGTKIIVKHRSGWEYPCKAGDTWSRDWKFGDVERDGDIICYRILEDKQPAPLTYDQALAWMVENVKFWPKDLSLKSFADGWETKIYTYPDGSYVVELFKEGMDNITEKDWQAARTVPASNKPSWDDAPEGANWLCQDADGAWAFSSCDHSPIKHTTYWRNEDTGFWLEKRWKDAPNPNWHDTLEHRPAAKEPTPVDMRQANSINVGEALADAATITPEQAEAIVGDAMAAEPSQEEKHSAVLSNLSKNLIRMKELKSSIALEEINLDLMRQEQDKLSHDISDVLLHFGY